MRIPPRSQWAVFLGLPPIVAMFVMAGVAAAEPRDGRYAGSDLDPFFQPPAEFRDDFGMYRSPLVFDDGQPVRSPADWEKRRTEIRTFWLHELGAWPPLVEKPALRILESDSRADYTQHKVEVQTGPGDMREAGYLLVPPGAGPFPAVLIVFYEPETSIGEGENKLLAFGRDLALRGFVTLSIGGPNLPPTEEGATAQPLSLMAYVAANCHSALAQRPEVDSERIGIMGHSYGGKWAMFASCLYDQFACAVWSDPGIVFDEDRANVNYWEPWYLGLEPRKSREPGIPSEANPRTGSYPRAPRPDGPAPLPRFRRL
jgi:hypothetical protein